ncbi:hypothetical protein BFJ68_g14705 [Fusarium oxysporum]|uniref:Fumarylacetoacetase-like C-terminal domain-containing protein n=1 Tax=Fusarium oxysporum TaxID=5507 RepID=A0A420PSW8_FUSOX|nr:hypothetical protein BFJ68_g14705 [Fusarium oxysporum]
MKKTDFVTQILSPLPFEGDIICIGTNYREHAKEANLPVPLDPVMWYKPRRALAGPGEVPIPPIAANGFLDYEGELCIVLSRDARDVKVEEASDYILGYTIGNDLTARSYQDPKRGGGQFTRCKAYDGFAPLGPILTNAKTFGGVGDKKITTKVNDTVFQNSLCDLIHSPETLVSFLSQGELQYKKLFFSSHELTRPRDNPASRHGDYDRLAARDWLFSEP